MFNALTTLAHAGEEHSDGLEAIGHVVAPWYLAVPVFFAVVAMVGYLTWLVSGRNPSTVIIVLSFTLLIIGFGTFSLSPIVSVLAILGGIILSGFMALVGLANGK